MADKGIEILAPGNKYKIVLPIMKPAIALQAIFTFVGSWNNYFIPTLILQTTNYYDPCIIGCSGTVP